MARNSGTAGYVPSTSNEAVRKATGRQWDEWFSVLDGERAYEWKHAEMAKWLASMHRLPSWWSQMVTVEYERSRGLRQVHEKAGGFAASASKTLPIPVEELYGWCVEAKRRRRWITVKGIVVRKATPSKSVRMTWSDGTRVTVSVYAKGETKSQVTIHHEKLPDAATVGHAKAEWKAALERLTSLVAR